jgi:hypothetical protein
MTPGVARLAATLIVLAAVGVAALFFWLGLEVATGEQDEVIWAVRAPLWGLGAVFLVAGLGSAWLVARSDPK